MAIFRLPRTKITAKNSDHKPGTFISPFTIYYQASTTWRELLIKMGRTQHVNNLGTLREITWEGLQLDSAVTIQFGSAVLDAIEKSHLVSINADVQFRLKSDFAKTFWPFIDSQPNFAYVDEERLAQLSGFGLAEATSARRAQFRKDCRQAFEDMVKAGGLVSWNNEIRGSGRKKSHRYHYQHAMPRQMELALIEP